MFQVIFSYDHLCISTETGNYDESTQYLFSKKLQKKRGTKYITPQLIGYAIEELMGDSYHSYYLNNVRYFSEPQRNSSQFLRIRLSSPGTFVGKYIYHRPTMCY